MPSEQLVDTAPRRFLASLLDSLADQIAVLDHNGTIRYVNEAWRKFGSGNGLSYDHPWIGDNYVTACKRSGENGDRMAAAIAARFHELFTGAIEEFEQEYPCHGPREPRWFAMRAAVLQDGTHTHFVVSHRNVTRRKLAEVKVAKLALRDPLSGIPNRRQFDQSLKDEWRRWKRGTAPISLLLVDIDHFKSYNDRFGHPTGDRCLKAVARAILPCARRAGDLAARVGGEEFAVLLPGMAHPLAQAVAEHLRATLAALPIGIQLKRPITVSVGIVTAHSGWVGTMSDFLRAADIQMYEAKRAGRNCVRAQLLSPEATGFTVSMLRRVPASPKRATQAITQRTSA